MPPPDGEEDLGLVERLWRRVFPPNWSSLRVGELRKAQSVMLETGICLTWVPPAAVIRAIISARSMGDQHAALLASESVILGDLARVTEEVTHPRLADVRDAAREAAAAYEAGYRRAAQALCASALSAVLSDDFGVPGFPEARRRLAQDRPGATSPRLLRRAYVQWSLRRAIEGARPDFPPQRFNRHLTAHSLAHEQFTDAYAVSALMLLTGVARELQELYAVGDNGFPLLAGTPEDPRRPVG